MILGYDQCVFDVRNEADVAMARVAARGIACAAGFDLATVSDIAVAATELARNLVVHAGGGSFAVRIQGTDWGRVLEIETRDHGPGIADVSLALADGFSTNGGLGCGLGAVNRMMDDLEIETSPEMGTRVRARRWLRTPLPFARLCPLDIGASERRASDAEASGSQYVLQRWEGGVLAGVIVAHGECDKATAACRDARLYLESHADSPLETLVREIEPYCNPSLGGAAFLVSFDCDASGIRFRLAGVGDAGARLYGGPKPLTFGPPSIDAGSAVPQVAEQPWSPDATLVIHTAGLLPLWPDERFAQLSRESAQSLANRLICALARDSEDAVVVVVKQAERAADLGIVVSPVVLPSGASDPKPWE